jgi:hypothetical protein
LAKIYQIRKNIPNWEKYTKWKQKIPNSLNIYQITAKYTKWREIYQNFPW